jgi:ring-1,2-phenylacetyl-CoA epoxidase subunit PaaC
MPALARYALALGDDTLVLSQRFGQWVSRAPQLEEDVALANIGLDLLGQARTLLTYAGEVEGLGRDEDDLAYLREDRDFLSCHLVELENGDFAFTIARLLVFSTYQHALYSALRSSTDPTLAAVAAKAVKEVDYHRDHATEWTLRLGDGTDESHRRMQAAADEVRRYAAELFDTAWIAPELLESGAAVDVSTLREGCERSWEAVLERATLALPEVVPAVGGGRRGVHDVRMGYLLAEMQHLHRSHPGASW